MVVVHFVDKADVHLVIGHPTRVGRKKGKGWKEVELWDGDIVSEETTKQPNSTGKFLLCNEYHYAVFT